jgi:hypothetical protein
MPGRENASHQDAKQTNRRTFLGALGVAAGWVGLTAMAPPSSISSRWRPGRSTVLPTAPRWTRISTTEEAARLLGTYPLPSYLPDGYSVTAARAGLPQGFRNGQAELSLIAHSPAGQPHVPMVVFITPGAARFLGSSYLATARTAQITRTDGTVASAAYFDGMWAADPSGIVLEGRKTPVRWTTEYLHSVVLSVGSFSIGVQAPVPANLGVSQEELLQVAASVTGR